GATNNAGLDQRIAGNGFISRELTGIHSSLNAAERYGVKALREDVLEAALRQATVKRHLAAFKAVDGYAGTRLLTLDTTTTGLAGARTDTTAQALARMRRALVVLDLVKFHVTSPGAQASS